MSPARPVLERLAYVCYLAMVVGSTGITGLGALTGTQTGDFTAMAVALGGLALSGWLHVHGHRHWHFREYESSFEMKEAPGVMPRSEEEEARAEEVAELLARLEAEPDVWERGDLRRVIRRRLEARPALREEFCETLAGHPEL